MVIKQQTMIAYTTLKVLASGLSLCILMLWFALYLMKNIDMADIVYVVYDKRNITRCLILFDYVTRAVIFVFVFAKQQCIQRRYYHVTHNGI